METINLWQWQTNFFTYYNKGGYRLGQHFINCFIKDEHGEDLCEGTRLWQEEDINVVKHMIARIIAKHKWDVNALPLLPNAPTYGGIVMKNDTNSEEPFSISGISDRTYRVNGRLAKARFIGGDKPTYSKGICDFITCGYGRCDEYGYFEFPLLVDQVTLEVLV